MKQLRKFLIANFNAFINFLEIQNAHWNRFITILPEADLPPTTHMETPLKVIFHSITLLPLTEATALAIPYKFG